MLNQVLDAFYVVTDEVSLRAYNIYSPYLRTIDALRTTSLFGMQLLGILTQVGTEKKRIYRNLTELLEDAMMYAAKLYGE